MVSGVGSTYPNYYQRQIQTETNRRTSFGKLDGNGDGTVDQTELAGALKSQFGDDGASSIASALLGAIDQDGRKSLSFSEFSGKFGSETGSALLQAQEDGSVRGNRPPGPPPGPPPSSADLLKDGDSDGDGSLSLDEFSALAPEGADSSQSKSIFTALDTDGDGKISAAELEAGKPKPPEGGSPAANDQSAADFLTSFGNFSPLGGTGSGGTGSGAGTSRLASDILQLLLQGNSSLAA